MTTAKNFLRGSTVIANYDGELGINTDKVLRNFLNDLNGGGYIRCIETLNDQLDKTLTLIRSPLA